MSADSIKAHRLLVSSTAIDVPPVGVARVPRALVALLFLTALSGRAQVPAGLPLAGVDARLVFAVPLAGWFLLWSAVNVTRLKQTRRNACTSWIVLFFVYHACSSLWFAPGARVARSVIGDLITILLVWVAGALCRADARKTRLTLLWCIYGAGVAYGVASFVTGATSGIGRAVAFGGGPNVFARVVILGGISAVVLYWLTRRRLLLLPLPLLLLAAVLSASRGALTALVATAFLTLVLISRRLRPRHLVVGLGSTIAVAWVIWHNDRFQLLAERRFDLQTLAESGYSGRPTLWAAARTLFEQHPWVGSGIDSFQAVMYASTGYPYPHNLVLEVAGDTGVIGVALLAIATLLATRQLLGLRRTGAYGPSALAISAAFVFVCCMFSGDIYDSRFLWLLIAAAVPVLSATPSYMTARARAARRQAMNAGVQ